IEGTLFGWIDYRLTPEFATTTSNVATSSNGTSVSGNTTLGTPEVIDAYFDAKFKPWLKLRVGKFKPFVGLARLQSDVDGKFLEQSFVTANLLPQRDVGAALFGDVLDGKLNYAVGYSNGVIDGGDQSVALDNNNDKEFTARVFAQPFKGNGTALAGLGFGLAGTNNEQTGTASRTQLPQYRSFSQLNFFSYNSGAFADGRRTRLSPQAYYYYGPFGLMTEYAHESQEVTRSTNHETLDHAAWQATFSYILTGEEASYGGVKPKQPFSPNGNGWGAWELVARLSGMSLDHDTFTGKTAGVRLADIATSARSAQAWGVGVNWYINNYTRFAMDYENTSFEGGATGSTVSASTGAVSKLVDRPDERAMIGRLQVSF
ncbi:MAG: OprO/OprP family phosphate-selective porin, partial [Methylophilaceae bacterium]